MHLLKSFLPSLFSTKKDWLSNSVFSLLCNRGGGWLGELEIWKQSTMPEIKNNWQGFLNWELKGSFYKVGEFQRCHLELATILEMCEITVLRWMGFLCNRRIARDLESMVISAKGNKVLRDSVYHLLSLIHCMESAVAIYRLVLSSSLASCYFSWYLGLVLLKLPVISPVEMRFKY